MKNFDGKVVAITGAGSGIGRALSQQLASLGAKLSIADVNEPALIETERVCKAIGAAVISSVLDVSNRIAVDVWAEETKAEFGNVNVVVNNAGVSLGASVEDMTYEDFEWLMNINFWGVVYGTKAFLPHLHESGDGHIVNVSSLFGLMAMPTQSAYNAAKFAVRGFSESLSEELRIENAPIYVTCVHPGGIDTNIARGGRVVANQKWGLIDPETSAKSFKKLARTTPDSAAHQIIEAIKGKQRRLLIGNDARIFDAVQRLFPDHYQSLVVKIMKWQAKQVQQAHAFD